MAEHTAKIIWRRSAEEKFTDRRYSRVHEWHFDGGAKIAASASPHIVPLPFSCAENVDPEEAFIAALSSCHMLFFLSLAAEQNWCVDVYEDQAIGTLAPNADGRLAITEVTLRPKVIFSGVQRPAREEQERMHHLAHEKCFIANSVRTAITISLMA